MNNNGSKLSLGVPRVLVVSSQIYNYNRFNMLTSFCKISHKPFISITSDSIEYTFFEENIMI